MIRLEKLFSLTEGLRRQAIGEPVWIPEKEVFEYPTRSVVVAAVLKAIRAANGVRALQVLCKSGLFIDMGVIYRCIDDCANEVLFLLEEFPKTSTNVDRFVTAFFEGTIDGFLSAETEAVPTKKIRSAVVRILNNNGQDEETRVRLERVHRTFSGYVHASYANVLEIYDGVSLDFNLRGVPSIAQRQIRTEYVEQACDTVLLALGFIALKLGLRELHQEVLRTLRCD